MAEARRWRGPSPVFWQELHRVAWRAAAGVFIGFWTQSWSIGALVFAALYLATQLHSLWRLRRWLKRPKHVELPEVAGLWGDVANDLYTLQRRNRKRKQRLAAILGEFRASTAALPYGTVVLSGRGQIAWFNDAAQLMLGLDFRKDVGQRIANLVRYPAFTEYFAAEIYDRSVEVPSPVNANITLSLRVVPYGRGQRLLIVRDVSDARRLHETRRDFVANASHELRAPLEILRGQLGSLDLTDAPNARWREAITRMRAQTARMEALVEDMLRLAELEAEVSFAHQVRVDIGELLEAVRSAAESLSRGTHRIQFVVEAGLDLLGRPSELYSAFANLVGNAVRYTPVGGDIVVRWHGTAQGAEFSVRDTGIGIAESELSRVTERFYRADKHHLDVAAGTGLGLSIVRHAVERHDGQLRVESVVGKGSTFTCTFPASRVLRGERTLPRGVASGAG